AQSEILIGDKKSAKDHIAEAIADSQDLQTRLRAAELLSLLGDKQAQKLLDEATNQGSTKYFVAANLALNEHNYNLAESNLKIIGNDDLEAAFYLANAYFQDQRYSDAVAEFELLADSKGKLIYDYNPLLWRMAQEKLAESKRHLQSNAPTNGAGATL